MKASGILMAVLMTVASGGAYAADFGDLAVKAGTLRSAVNFAAGVPAPNVDKAVRRDCSFAHSLTRCEILSGCTWDSNGLGGGTCIEDTSPGISCSFAHSMSSCESQSGCTWESTGLGSGTCEDSGRGRGIGNISKQPQGIISAKQFIDALPMERILPLLQGNRISEEKFKAEAIAGLPSDVALWPAISVVQVIAKAAGCRGYQQDMYGCEDARLMRRVWGTVTDLSLKLDPNNAVATLVSNQRSWEWGCKHPVSYLGKGCEPENQILMKEFITIP